MIFSIYQVIAFMSHLDSASTAVMKSLFPKLWIPYTNWFNTHKNHCNNIKNYSTLLIGDSIIAGLSQYNNGWKKYFEPLNSINCGIGGDKYKMCYRGVIVSLHRPISTMLSLCVALIISMLILQKIL